MAEDHQQEWKAALYQFQVCIYAFIFFLDAIAYLHM